MEWQLTNNNQLAYKIKDGRLWMTDQICTSTNSVTGEEEGFVAIDDSSSFSIDKFKINEDGSIDIDHWNELRQFNCCNALTEELQLLNEIVAVKTGTPPVVFDLDSILKEPSIFEVNRVTYDQLVKYDSGSYEVDLGFEIRIGEDLISGTTQFIKYTFFNELICKKRWTIKELANFSVHFQKFLYECEKVAKSENFFGVDDELLQKLNK